MGPKQEHNYRTCNHHCTGFATCRDHLSTPMLRSRIYCILNIATKHRREAFKSEAPSVSSHNLRRKISHECTQGHQKAKRKKNHNTTLIQLLSSDSETQTCQQVSLWRSSDSEQASNWIIANKLETEVLTAQH
jgi:hypothetical protein